MFSTSRSRNAAETGSAVYEAGSSVLGKWRITASIGAGSFGRVFKIERSDGLLSETSALKVITVPRSDAELQALRSGGMSTAQARQYLEGMANDVVREVSIMSKLKGCSNIVSYEDCEKVPHAGGIGWDILIRMELLHPLLTYAYEHPFSRRDIIKLGIDISRALELCQRYNIIHRDVKPENIFVSENGDFKLGDFGISRSFAQTAAASTRVGTGNYMAPEVFRGEKYGFSVDIYSLGLVLYRLLNKNRLPFLPPAPQGMLPSDQEAAFAKRISGAPIPPPYYSQGRLPEIVLKACAYDPKDRYSSPTQMRQELEAILYEQRDAAYIYPDGDTLENLREYYTSQKSGAGGNANGNSGKTAHIFSSGTRTEIVGPEESGPPQEHQPPEERRPPDHRSEPKQNKKLIGVLAAVCACAVIAAVGLFAVSRGGNPADPDEPPPPSQSVPVEATPPSAPVQATQENDSGIENGTQAEAASGTCGTNVTWSLSGSTLTISGTGAMTDYTTSENLPWFSRKDALTGVVINDGVTRIGNYGFCGCTGLTSVTIPGSVTSIGDWTFTGCGNLTGVTIPDGVTAIGDWAFYFCSGLTGVTIPDSVTSIGGHAFSDCFGLTNLTIGCRVASIGDGAFSGCTGLTSVTIPDSVTGIGSQAFSGCGRLTSMTIPDSVTSIAFGAFARCTGLTEVTIPAGITKIELATFDDCTSLTDVYYTGTQTQWNAITIANDNDPLLNATVHCLGG